MSSVTLRPATEDDIPLLIELMHIASYGFVQHIFAKLSAPGADVSLVLSERLKDPTSHLALSKARIAEKEGIAAGFIMCEDLPDPVSLIEPDTPDLLRPLFELEESAPGTRLVNFIATLPQMRGGGVGDALIAHAETSPGPNGMCLTIHDLNHHARLFYEKRGFRETARRAIVKHGWAHPATEWVLMTKPVGAHTYATAPKKR